MKAEFISQPFGEQTWPKKTSHMLIQIGIISATLGRISFAVYLLRLVAHCRNRRWFLHFLIIQNAFANGLLIVLLFCQCSNIRFNWDSSAHVGECWHSDMLRGAGIFQGSSGAFTDLFLTIIPITLISSLHIEIHLKIGLSFLLGVGSL
jgi:hypothetical protein